jgi:hypothetical protein
MERDGYWREGEWKIDGGSGSDEEQPLVGPG